MDSYLLCDKEYLLDRALEELKVSSYIIVDCEGKDLGRENGALSFISLRTTSPAPLQTFLVDAISLGNSTLQSLFDLLGSNHPKKVVYDGRMDFNELYHGHHVTLRGVLDLQLADVTSRNLRGEGEDEQLQRLFPYLHRREVFSQRNSYTHVQKILGLDACLKEHGLEFSKAGFMSHDSWLQRPLPGNYLLYAARDVYNISLLFEHFTRENYIDHDRLAVQSEQYITMWKDARPRARDVFKNHALLPLCILDSSRKSSVLKRPCRSCNRNLPSECYSKTGWRLAAKRQCLVCRALSVIENIKAQWARDLDELERDGDGYGSDGYGSGGYGSDGYGSD